MKAWIKSLSSDQYMRFFALCTFSAFGLTMFLVWAPGLPKWAGLIGIAVQLATSRALIRARWACSVCKKNACAEHFKP